MGYAEERKFWTREQIAIVEDLIDKEQYRGFIRWENHVETIGHPIGTIKFMARSIRSRRREKEWRVLNANLRALADQAVKSSEAPDPSVTTKPAPKYQTKPAPKEVSDTMRCTSTARLMRDVEIRFRSENPFGDPEPGRSALDRKRNGEIEQARRPSLATSINIPKRSPRHGAKSPSFAPLASASNFAPALRDADASFSDGAP
jgi:hypothetical protein